MAEIKSYSGTCESCLHSQVCQYKEERKEIFKIHIENKHRDVTKFDLDQLADKTNGLTGAEIGSLVSDALFNAFSKGSDLNTCDIIEERAKLTPLSTIMAEKITSLRLWAKNRARIAGDEFVEKIEGEDSIVRLKTECYNPLLG